MSEVTFVAPSSIEDILVELAAPDAVLVGGGTSLALLTRAGLIEPSRFVSTGNVEELRGIAFFDDVIELGAATTLREIARDEQVREHAPALAFAAANVGNPRVRAVATVAGAICHGDPRQDLPPVLLAANAKIRVVGPGGSREIELAGFYTGFMENLLADDELVTSIIVPARQGLRSNYQRFTPNSADDYPTVAAAVALQIGADGVVREARLALGGVDVTAVLAHEAAAFLVGVVLDDARIRGAAGLAAEHCDPTTDNRGSAGYKRDMIAVILGRGLTAAVA